MLRLLSRDYAKGIKAMNTYKTTSNDLSRLARDAVRLAVLVLTFFCAGLFFGKLIVLWIIGGEPPWMLSAPLFVQMFVNALIAAALFMLATTGRSALIDKREMITLSLCVSACLITAVVSSSSETWRGERDWVTAAGLALLLLYSVWLALRRRAR
jgi:hypothetical protein